MSGTDSKLVQYVAAAIILSAYCGSLFVLVFDLIVRPDQAIPNTVTGIVFGGLTIAASLFGVHLGGVTTSATASLTSQISQQVAATVAEGIRASAQQAVTLAQTPPVAKP